MATADYPASQANLLRQITHYAVAIFVPAMTSLGAAAIYTRIFSSSAYGQYSLVLVIVNFLSFFLGQWLQQSIIRYLPGDNRRTVLGAVKLGLVILCAIQVPLYAVWWKLFALTHIEIRYLVPSCILVMLTVYSSVIGAILQAEQQSRLYARFQVANNVVKFITSLLLIFWRWRSPTSIVWGMVLGYLVIIIPQTKLSLLFSDGVWHSRKELSSYWKSLIGMFKYGAPMMGYFSASLILSMSDRFIIAVTRGNVEVGIYSANYNLISGSLGLITGPIITAAHPFLMSSWSKRNTAETSLWLQKIALAIVSLGIVLIGLTWLLAPDLAALFLGARFRQGSLIMPVVLGGGVAMAFANYAHKPFEFFEKTQIMMMLAILSAVLNVILNFLFVPKFGYVAAAWSTLACYIFYASITYALGKRLLRWHMPYKKLIGVSLITGVSYLLAHEIIVMLPPRALIFRITLGGTAYMLLPGSILWKQLKSWSKAKRG